MRLAVWEGIDVQSSLVSPSAEACVSGVTPVSVGHRLTNLPILLGASRAEPLRSQSRKRDQFETRVMRQNFAVSPEGDSSCPLRSLHSLTLGH